MSLNIFEIWESIGRKTPFAVRRDNWTKEYYTIVERVECEKLPYGKAFGYPTVNGKFSNHYNYDTKWNREKLIPGCGCYQWTIVENGVQSISKEELKEKDISVSGGFTISSKFNYGKYKDLTVEEVFNENPGYIEWSIKNIDKFFLTPENFDNLGKLKNNFKFSETTQQMNFEKIARQQKA